MNNWIFQGNPDVFDIDKYLEENDSILWSVRQAHLADSMSVGDCVYIWRASGKSKATAGVVAKAIITDTPKLIPDDASSKDLWFTDGYYKEELRVSLSIEKRCLGKKQVVQREWLKDDPDVSTMRIMKMANETNYLLKPKEARRLNSLVENTGRPWTREESIAGLWAYAQTYGSSVSKAPGSQISKTAVTIGRAVTGIYNKVMNFRAIDPRDERKGLSAGSEVDLKVWNEFYDPETDTLDTDRLNRVARDLWGEPVNTRAYYGDFGEAPDDNPEDIRKFLAKVRKGQPKFRKNLLEAYGGRCAITGHGPEEVLEAVHIVPHATSGINKLDNGLLMRADLHTLFDSKLLTIHPDTLEIILSKKLKSTPYWDLNGVKLRSREDGSNLSDVYLRQSYEEIDTEDF